MNLTLKKKKKKKWPKLNEFETQSWGMKLERESETVFLGHENKANGTFSEPR